MSVEIKRRKVALVTGATRGIGQAIAHELAGLGYELILTGTNHQQIETLNQSSAKNVLYKMVDFSDEHSSKAFF